MDSLGIVDSLVVALGLTVEQAQLTPGEGERGAYLAGKMAALTKPFGTPYASLKSTPVVFRVGFVHGMREHFDQAAGSDVTCKEAGRRGAATTLARHGVEHLRRIGSIGAARRMETVSPERRIEIARAGGKATAERHDRKWFSNLGRKGIRALKAKLKSDPEAARRAYERRYGAGFVPKRVDGARYPENPYPGFVWRAYDYGKVKHAIDNNAAPVCGRKATPVTVDPGARSYCRLCLKWLEGNASAAI